MRCEDYPCCGHTPADPCDAQWYDEPDAFDLSRNPHAFCDHAEGFCDAEYADDDEHDIDNDTEGGAWCYAHDCRAVECDTD